MQTSLARRQRHRRALQGRPKGRGGSTIGRVLLVIFLIFLVIALLTTGAGLVFAVGAYNHYAAGLPEPKEALTNLDFDQQTLVYDRTGKVELAKLGSLRREVVTFDQIPGEMIDATTAIEDKDFWINAGFDPDRHRRRRPRHPVGPAARRLDDHAAARSGAPAAARGVRGDHVRPQGPRDHPVGAADAGVSRADRQGTDRHGLPEPELLRQQQLRREGGGQGLLRQAARGPDAGPVRDPRGHPAVTDEVRPDEERRRGLRRGRRRGRGMPRLPARRSRRRRRSSSAGTTSWSS